MHLTGRTIHLVATAAVVGWCAAGAAGAPILPQMATGARVDESKVTRTFHVDNRHARAADDRTHGADGAPFKTLAYGLAVAADAHDKGIGVKVVVGDGTYREAVSVRAPATNAVRTAPLVIQARNAGRAIVSGSDTAGWEGATWTKQGDDYTHAWPFRRPLMPKSRFGSPEVPHEGMRRAELIFVNNQCLQQVTAREDLRPGRFFVATDNSAAKITTGPVTVRPPKNVDLASATIEVTTRDRALALSKRDNIVIRGLVFQHVTEFVDSNWPVGLWLNQCSNTLVEDVTVQWNNANGLGYSGSQKAPWTQNITLRRVRMNHNGGNGLFGWFAKNVLVEDSETSHNSFRLRWANHVEGWGSGGFKVMRTHVTTYRRHRSINNHSTGMWWDADNSHITAEHCVMRGNYIRGMFVEYGPGPVLVRDCVITRTQSARTYDPVHERPAALSISTTPDVTLERNLVYDNDVPQFGLWDLVRRRDAPNFETGQVDDSRPLRHHYRNNVFVAKRFGQTIWNIPLVVDKTPLDFYFETLDSQNNLFFHPERTHVFGNFRRNAYEGEQHSLGEWRALVASLTKTPQEVGSLWQNPRFADPDNGNFQPLPDSPIAGWNLPTHATTTAREEKATPPAPL